MFFSKKGQAFDVFKLLIAAIVAMALLALLIPIITGIGGGFGTKPADEAQTLIKGIAGHKATPQTSKKVVFDPNMSINSRSIADGSNGLVSTDQVCLSSGDFAEDETWETSDTMMIVRYKGSTGKQVQLEAICDTADAMSESDYFEIDPRLQIDGVDWASDCECIANGGTETCCVMAIKKV